jgi:hypothetical protein
MRVAGLCKSVKLESVYARLFNTIGGGTNFNWDQVSLRLFSWFIFLIESSLEVFQVELPSWTRLGATIVS